MKSILLLLIITLLGCSSNMKQEPISKSGIPVINLSEDVSTVPSLLLSESAEKLEIVPLEMTDQSMLGEIRRIQVTEHDIWIHDFNKFYSVIDYLRFAIAAIIIKENTPHSFKDVIVLFYSLIHEFNILDIIVALNRIKVVNSSDMALRNQVLQFIEYIVVHYTKKIL